MAKCDTVWTAADAEVVGEEVTESLPRRFINIVELQREWSMDTMHASAIVEP